MLQCVKSRIQTLVAQVRTENYFWSMVTLLTLIEAGWRLIPGRNAGAALLEAAPALDQQIDVKRYDTAHFLRDVILEHVYFV